MLQLKYHRKERIRKATHLRQEQEAQAAARLLERACKRVSIGARKGLDLDPAGQVRALESYIDSLREVIDDLESKYGQDASEAISKMQFEVRQAIEKIADLRRLAVKPD